ncbi:tetratricopeptide repeat protein [Micromonospora sp. WMMD812]|uniref:tetratricopeptide repeat protein n=1 Tax=Micromonospora sp. WMMD812 TaxID=3015152 RepID=UPI00248C7BAC|nr:tetratricopeptide repeat protein [Micromonospora sp. WMMD812]WBB69400.1 tetratricopeptide repeat protein [Micromonospora sp. WMMD812]
MATVLLLTGVVLLVGTAVVTTRAPDAPPTRPAVSGNGAPVEPQVSGAALDKVIETAQQRLRQLPTDWSTWARLGSAYVQQGRGTADPSYYPKAEGALRRSLELEDGTNWQAMAGMGALANARHDFHAALDWGRRAEKANPHAGAVHGVLVDALTQLGDYDGARTALQRMLDVEPGLSAFTRASYDFEQRGEVTAARDALDRAMAGAVTPADLVFCRYYLGELAFNTGDPVEALRQYDAGLKADPDYRLLYAGRAKAKAAMGQTSDALTDYDRVVQALPLPELLAEYGDALTAAGRPDQAREQYHLVDTARQLQGQNGVADHLGAAIYLADHGEPAAALAEAETEWKARRSVLAADALAWALHRNGRDSEALDFAIEATRLGWRNATFYYHRGVIRHALGDRDRARQDLRTALEINPHFDVVQAPLATQLLDSLGAGR